VIRGPPCPPLGWVVFSPTVVFFLFFVIWSIDPKSQSPLPHKIRSFRDPVFARPCGLELFFFCVHFCRRSPPVLASVAVVSSLTFDVDLEVFSGESVFFVLQFFFSWPPRGLFVVQLPYECFFKLTLVVGLVPTLVLLFFHFCAEKCGQLQLSGLLVLRRCLGLAAR